MPAQPITMASALDEATCRRVNLGFLDHREFRREDYDNDPDTLVVERAGRELTEGLETNHPLLTTLRVGKASIDVAVIGTIIAVSWPPSFWMTSRMGCGLSSWRR